MRVYVENNLSVIQDFINKDIRRPIMKNAKKFARNIAPYDSSGKGQHLRDALKLLQKSKISTLTLYQPTGKNDRPYHMWQHDIGKVTFTNKNGTTKGYELSTLNYSGKDPMFMFSTLKHIQSMVDKEIKQ